MNPNKKTARIAGLWYLCIAILYSFGMIYGQKAFYVPGDATATINNILASEGIFRLSIVSCLVGHICFLFLANALYKLFKPVNSDLARQMVLFIIAGVSVSFLNSLNQLASILIMNGSGYLSVFEPSQLRALSMTFIDVYQYGFYMAAIFWGLWLLPLGLLILKSNLMPKVLGILLLSACCCYLINFIVFFFFSGYISATKPVLSIVETAAEVAFILWLLIMGVKNQKTAQ